MSTSVGPDFSLSGEIPRRTLPLRYRLALVATSAASVLLPIAYVAIILFAAWVVWRYATSDFGQEVLHTQQIHVWGWFIYLGPIVAGAVLMLFMIKPLFAPRSGDVAPVEIDLAQEPRLRELISAICARMGAPLPTRVEVNCQPNASARLRRGLLSIGRRDLVLTIGLPLAGALSGRQFAGVLAHEFGHFAQHNAMALGYVIRSINLWFARVIFERDRLDRELQRVMERNHNLVGAVAGTALGAAWLGRKILHGFMLAGNAITCVQLRQMEYDADYYQTWVAGSAGLAGALEAMRPLEAANHLAVHQLNLLWQNGRLASDFPALLLSCRGQPLPEALAETTVTRANRWFATHPTDAQRITQAGTLDRPGLFQGELPATALFKDFGSLCREATRHFYRRQLRLPYDEGSVVASAQAQQTNHALASANAAYLRLAGTVLDLNRPLLWRATDFTPPAANDSVDFARELGARRAQLNALRARAAGDQATYGSIRKHLTEKEIALSLISACIEFRPGIFGLAKADAAEADADRRQLLERESRKAAELRPFETALHDWIRLVGRAARDPAFAAGLPGDTVRRIILLTDVLAGLAPWFEAYGSWLVEGTLLQVFASLEAEQARGRRFAIEYARIQDRVRAILAAAPALVGDTPHPLASDSRAADVLARSLPEGDPLARLTTLMHSVSGHYFHTLAELTLLGEVLEQNRAGATSPPAG